MFQTASWSVQPFLHSSQQGVPVLYFPPNYPFPWGMAAAPSNTMFLGPTRVHIPNGILISSAIFVQLSADGHYTLQWVALFHLKIAPSEEDLNPHKNTVPLAHPSPHPKWHLYRFSCFAWLMILTDKPRYSICNNRRHLHGTAMRPNNNNNDDNNYDDDDNNIS